MYLTGLGTALPQYRYTQAECYEALKASPVWDRLAGRSQAILRKVLLGQNGIETRCFAMRELTEAFRISPDTMLERFLGSAPALAEQAARAALEDAGLEPGDAGGLIVATCTGYLCPGLTSYVSERLGLSASAATLDLVGLGCGAALPSLRTAAAMAASGSADRIIVVCVEIGSAAFFIDDDPGVLVSACLFGDGAAAAIVSSVPDQRLDRRSLRWKSSASLTKPEWRDLLRFDHCQGLLRNILSPEVPRLAGEAAMQVFDELAPQHSLDRGDIAAWIWHAGGRDVLRTLCERFGIPAEDVRWSTEVLRQCGNMSSPSCLFALKAARDGGAAPGNWWMGSFGAGFTSHGAILEVS